MSLSLQAKLTLFTPIACRILARRKRPSGAVVAMTDSEIRDSACLPMSIVKSLSWSASWDNVEIRHMLAFTKGCGIDLDSRECVRTNTRYLRQGAWSHVRNSPERNTLYRELLAEWRKQKGVT